MSDDVVQQESETAESTSRLMSTVSGLRSWSSVHPWRSAAIVGVLMLMIAGTLGGWVYLSSLAIQDVPLTLEDALAAWDKRDFKLAREIIGDLQGQAGFDELLGDALFILGGIRAVEASEQPLRSRRQSDYLVAARYLEESRGYGFPTDREAEGLFLLGQSLVESNQLEPGIEKLNEALAAGSVETSRIHRLLTRSYLARPEPNFEQAFTHNQAELADPTLSAKQKPGALVRRAQVLVGLGKYKEAGQSAAAIPSNAEEKAWRELILGQAKLGQASRLASDSNEFGNLIGQAQAHLESAQAQDHFVTEVTRQAMYLQAESEILQDNLPGALQQFVTIRRNFRATPEGMAASLAEAEIELAAKNRDESLDAYRRVLESVGRPKDYQNPFVTLSSVRARLEKGVETFIDDKDFEGALDLAEHFVPLFSRTNQVERLARIHETWGKQLLDQAVEKTVESDQIRERGRLQLRMAGREYEELAHLRYATKYYPEDLWKCAENYYLGQSYSSTIRVLEDYLAQEPELRNAQALMRLGQSQLAMGKLRESIASFEECMQFHPGDEAVYQARNDASRAYRLLGNIERSEELLLDNLRRSKLTPRSPEWLDALYEIGDLAYEADRFDQAVDHLDEYIQRVELEQERYEDVPLEIRARQADIIPAKYLIAESYRRSVEEVVPPVNDRGGAVSTGQQRQVSDRRKQAAQYYQEVLREIKRDGDGFQNNPTRKAMFRNCYMMLGAVLFDQGRYAEAREAYQNISSLYVNEPFVLDTYVQIAHCWRRLDEPEKARGTVREAQYVLNQLPADVDFLATTNFSREQWESVIDEMVKW